ncbi:MAG: tetratricopeptide repeat protein, partial [Muribaculaceae bacterium]|nr:tetratricopeptide repeat protein [Muribaculaceae bacterium]
MKKTFISVLLVLAAAGTAMAQDSPDVGAGVTKELRLTIREGNDFYNKGNYAKALESYEVALQLNPGSQVALYNKALALINMAGEDSRGTENDPRAQGMQMLEQVARNCAVSDGALAEKALYNLGNMAYNDQDYARSIERYKQALKINPDNNRTRQNLRL